MSLYKQLNLTLFFLFLILLAGTLLVNFNSTQRYLNDQLRSQVEDTATSLGLSLSPYLEDNDTSSIQTTVNAIFDRGYYREISVIDTDGNVLVTRQQPVVVVGVPDWFIRLIRINVPDVMREVSSGWAISGDIRVVGHAGYAYRELWQIFSKSLVWFAVVLAALMLLGNRVLKLLLRPLEAVRVQAEAICRRHRFEIPVPRTLELRRVVTAMNRMVGHVKTLFDEQSAVAEELRRAAWQDELTGLGNGRWFRGHLESMLTKANETFRPGVLYLVRVHDFSGFNHRAGLEAGDAVLCKIAEILRQCSGKYHDCLLARVKGGEFALMINGQGREEAANLAQVICHALAQLSGRGLYDRSNVVHLGLAMVERPESPGIVFSRADRALRDACSSGENTWAIFSPGSEKGFREGGNQQWLRYLAGVIERGEMSVLTQKVVDNLHGILHRETFVRIRDERGGLCPAGRFMVSAEQLGRTREIDRFVIEKMVEVLLAADEDLEEAFAVNLSMDSLNDPEFRQWLLGMLDRLPRPEVEDGGNSGVAPKRVIIEVSEAIAVNNLEALCSLSEELHIRGHGLGLDHFGRGFSNFGYLNSLRPDYVKIDSAYTADIGNNPDNRFFLHTLSTICRSLEIGVIAQCVENTEQWESLIGLDVDGVQGYAVSEPVAC